MIDSAAAAVGWRRSQALWPASESQFKSPLSLPWAVVLAGCLCVALVLGVAAGSRRPVPAPHVAITWVQRAPAQPTALTPSPAGRSQPQPRPEVATPPRAAGAMTRQPDVPAARESARRVRESEPKVPSVSAPAPATDFARPTPDAEPSSPLPRGEAAEQPAATSPEPDRSPAARGSAPSAPVPGDARTVCPVQLAPRWPDAVYAEGLNDEAQVQALAQVRNGRVVSVEILSGPRVLHRAVREAMLQYRCQTPPGETLEITQIFTFRQEPAR